MQPTVRHAVLNQLMRTAVEDSDGDAADSTVARDTLAEEVGSLLRDYNQSIQEESKDRKYRFVVGRLMKSHQQGDADLDIELDYYRDDDDVAVLFTAADGSKFWGFLVTSRRWV